MASIEARPPQSDRRHPRVLRAGSLVAVLDSCDLRRIGYRGHEVAQQVFVAVRSIGWDTVPGELAELVVNTHADAFEVTFTSRHASADDVLEWRGVIRGDPSGTIGYTAEITSPTGFAYERVGFNVLHGVEAVRGRQVRAWLGGRLVHQQRLPELVGPQRMVDGRETGLFTPFDRLELEVTDRIVAEIAFEGDEFEMEDQRNYGDGSFKTYSTPLQRPGPFVLAAGSTLHQSVTIRARDDGDAPSSTGRRSATRVDSGMSVVRLRDSPVGTLPPLGLSHPVGGPASTPSGIERLVALRPDHLRVEHVVGSDIGGVAASGRLAAALRVPLIVEVRVAHGDPAAGAVDAILGGGPDAIRVGAPIRQLLIDVPGAEPIDGGPTRHLLERARALVRARGAATGVGVARDFLAEVLRSPFDGAVVGCLSFALSPGVHRSDDWTLIENLAGIADAVRSAREAFGAGMLLIGPITLATRHGPYPDGPRRDDGSPASDDPREAGLFGAAWLVGCIAELSRGAPDAVTIATTFGPTGLVRPPGDDDLEGGASTGPSVSPTWHLLADLAGLAGAPVLELETDGRCSAVAIRTPTGIRVWIASRGMGPTRVRLEGTIWTEGRVRVLEAVTLATATRDPDAFRTAGVVTSFGDGRSSIVLDGHSVVRVDLAGSPSAT